MNHSKAVIILGMHRSGTSAMSGLLSQIGFFMGSKLFKAQQGVNERGFFENSAVVSINERLFDLLHSSWDDPLFSLKQSLPLESNEYKALHTEAVALISKEYKAQPCWGMKDPRVSVLIEFWRSVFAQAGVQPNYIVMLRHPAEVHMSLAKRDSFSTEKSLILWLSYTLCSVRGFSPDHNAVVLYEELMTEHKRVAQDVLVHLFPDTEFDVKKADGFISKSLKNNHGTFDDLVCEDQLLLALTKRLYTEVSSKTINTEVIAQLDAEFNTYLTSLSPVLAEHLSTVKHSEVLYRGLFDQAYYTWWWKVSWPLRFLEKKIRHSR
tara:strand:+ start:1330 stop:2295 length:966 start_codon:yes stop_codon:yes gene_type:complete